MRYWILSAVMAVMLAPIPGAAREGGLLNWDTLVDAEAQVFDDPYAALAPAQINDLVTIVRLRDRLASGEVNADARPRIEARLSDIEASFAAAGIDVDWLIDQRWVVAERRQVAALAGNPALDGQAVEIAGFLIPAPPDDDGTPMAYLVPERGMCSHMPPPPPNQLLRIRLAETHDIPLLYTPAIVRGTIRLQETNREVFVVDGPVPMWSAWTLQASQLENLGPGAREWTPLHGPDVTSGVLTK
ncbi:MAG: DUF3299 domain-containing protein [Pseudomonadota bacterium]